MNGARIPGFPKKLEDEINMQEKREMKLWQLQCCHLQHMIDGDSLGVVEEAVAAA